MGELGRSWGELDLRNPGRRGNQERKDKLGSSARGTARWR